MENIEEVIQNFISMTFSESLEFMVYAFIGAFSVFLALFALVWAIVQVWGLFKDITKS